MTKSATLILLPGLDGTGELFAPLLEYLPDNILVRVQRYPLDPAMGYAELEALVLASLPADQPIFVLGESFSGPIAIRIAAARPHQVIGLILCCSFACNPRPKLSWLKPLAGAIPFTLLPQKPLLSLLLNDAGNRLAYLVNDVMKRLPSPVISKRLKEVCEVDHVELLTASSCPVLSLRAQTDRLVPASAEQCLQHELGDRLQTLTLPGPHGLLQYAPALAADAIARFLSNIQSKQTPEKGGQQ